MTGTAEPVEAFFALSESNRFAIAELLADRGPLSAGTISAGFEISAPAISQHLRVLRQARIVTMEKRGQMRLYSLNDEAFDRIGDWVDLMRKRLQSRYDKLEQMLNEEES